MVIVHILLSGEKIRNLKLLAPENGTVIQLQSLKTFFNLLSFSFLSIESLWTLPLVLSVRGVGKYIWNISRTASSVLQYLIG